MVHENIMDNINAGIAEHQLAFLEKEWDELFDTFTQLFFLAMAPFNTSSFHMESFLLKNNLVDDELVISVEGFVEGVSNLISKIADGIKAVFEKITGIFSKNSSSMDYVSNSSSDKIDKAVTDNTKKYNLPSKETHEKMVNGFGELLKMFILGVKSIEAPKKDSDPKDLTKSAHQLFSFGQVVEEDTRGDEEKEIDEAVDKHKKEEATKQKIGYVEIAWSDKAKSLFETIGIEVGDEASFYKTKKKLMFGLKTKEEEQFNFKIEPLDFEKFESKTLSEAGYTSKEAILSLTEQFTKIKKQYTDTSTTGLFTKKVKDVEQAYVITARKSVHSRDYESMAKAMAPYCILATNFAKVYSKTFLMVLGHMNRYYLMTHKCLQDALKETEKSEKKEN